MTNEEKFTAIIERLKETGKDLEPHYISVMVIIGYLDAIQKKGMVTCAFTMTPLGENIMAICEEFDWKPSDAEIKRFVKDMVEEQDGPAFEHMIKCYRDDRDALFQEFEESRNSE